MPFFTVGGLLLFMVTASTFAVNCESVCPQTCRPCCIMFSDFIAFIVMAAEVVLGVITLASTDFVLKELKQVRHMVENDSNCVQPQCDPTLIDQVEGWLFVIGIGSFVAAGLQLVRLIAGRGVRQRPRERFPTNVQWEQAYDDLRTNSRRDTPYQRMHGNMGPRDPNAV